MRSYAVRYSTLVLVGDAIASYLDCPDDQTKRKCLMSCHDIPRRWLKRNPYRKQLPKSSIETSRNKWGERSRERWSIGPSRRRWLTLSLLFVVALSACSWLLKTAAVELQDSEFDDPFALGFGVVNNRAVIHSDTLPQNGAGGLVSSVLIANIPQAVASLVYPLYNSVLTYMLLAKVAH